MPEKIITPERAAELKKLAADFQPELAKVAPHYDDVQLAMLAKAAVLALDWPEVKVFSAEVHRLRIAAP